MFWVRLDFLCRKSYKARHKRIFQNSINQQNTFINIIQKHRPTKTFFPVFHPSTSLPIAFASLALHVCQVFLELIQVIIFYFIERHSKNMKFTSSLLTSSTKQTLLNSLNDQLRRPQQPITVFTRKDGKVYRLAIPLEDKTINELLLDAIQQFNADHELNLNSDTSTFLLYAAKKNGKICSDYPAFEPNQNVILTKVFHFYLKQKPTKPEQSRILTNFANQPKEEVKVQQRAFCSCLFSSRK